jgi:hypothetical protein
MPPEYDETLKASIGQVNGMKSLFEYLNIPQQEELERYTALLCRRFRPQAIICTRARISSSVSLDCWNKDRVKQSCLLDILLLGEELAGQEAEIRDFTYRNFEGGSIDLFFASEVEASGRERRPEIALFCRKGFLLHEKEVIVY